MAAGVNFGGASSAPAVSAATAFSAAFFFFFPDLGLADVFNSVRISVSENKYVSKLSMRSCKLLGKVNIKVNKNQ